MINLEVLRSKFVGTKQNVIHEPPHPVPARLNSLYNYAFLGKILGKKQFTFLKLLRKPSF
jgi:hypothetical protein